MSKNGCAVRVVCVVISLVLTFGSARSEQPDTLAARVLKTLERPVGLVHLPRCGDGSLAVAFARMDDGLRVHGQDADVANVVAARKAADQLGLFNRRVFIDHSSPDRLLPVGRSCDLVVIVDLARDELTPELAAEVHRVLHPWYGVAVIGDVSGELNRTDLSDWAKTIAPNVSSLPAQGTLVVVKAEPLEGADNWTHWWHGPDNNNVSMDTAFSMPQTMQWTGKPHFPPSHTDLPIIAQGRLYILWNGGKRDGMERFAKDIDKGPLLEARTVGSGVRLWVRRLSMAVWDQSPRSVLVADRDCLLVADGNAVVELDGATGRELHRETIETGEIKWMAVAGGRVFVLGGPVKEGIGRAKESVLQLRIGGEDLIALDRKTWKLLWRKHRMSGKDAYDPRSPAVSGNGLFICQEGNVAERLDIGTGESVWSVPLDFKRSTTVDDAMGGYTWDYDSRKPVSGFAMPGIYLITAVELPEAIVLSQEDGRRLWTPPGRGKYITVAYKGRLWLNQKGPHDSTVDPLTGEIGQSEFHPFKGAGCSRLVMAPFLENAPYGPADKLKSNCGAGTYVANGLIWKFPVPCNGCIPWRGIMARSPREDLPPLKHRLFKSEEVPATGSASSRGWATYRGNMRRSFSSSAVVPAEGRILWQQEQASAQADKQQVAPLDYGLGRKQSQWMFEAEFVPRPPVIADDRVVVARSTGVVDALDLDSGKHVWRAYTGGRIQSVPTIWRDRVFVGSCDGFLYAFALVDGRELFRLHAAPRTGRMMFYEQLGSRWPVMGSPAVHDGKVVVMAGLLEEIDGVYAVCADAETGHIIWEQSDWTSAETEGKLTGGGQFSVADQLFYHGDKAPPIRIDPANGSCRPAFPETAAKKYNTIHAKDFLKAWMIPKGQDSAILHPRWILYGGRRLLVNEDDLGTWRYSPKILGRDSEGRGRLPVVDIPGSTLLPAWDDDDALFVTKTRHGVCLTLVPHKKLINALQSLLAGTSTQGFLAEGVFRRSGFQVGFTPVVEGLYRWNVERPKQYDNFAWALTANAALLVYNEHFDREPPRLAAFDRRDGSLIWEIKLPGLPVRSGLAVAADGRIVLSMLDGSVIAVGK